MDKETKSYLIIFGSFLAVATLVFIAGVVMGKRGGSDDK